jgi:NAD+ kinase
MIKKIAVFPNANKDAGLDITRQLVQWLEIRGVSVMLNESTASKIERSDLAYSGHSMYSEPDIIIALGGDGTLLSIARQVCLYQIPILCINLGHLGFLTEVEVSDMYPALEKVLEGRYSIENRMMLQIAVIRDDMEVEAFYALNDAVISKGSFSRLIRLKAYIDDEFVNNYIADGLIIATPTGSTAYSLSAGGPIVSPNLESILLTPICPHSLNSRSLVISDKEVIRIYIDDPSSDIVMTIDGQEGFRVANGDIVMLKKAGIYTHLVRVSGKSFYKLLHEKLYDIDAQRLRD